jgi:hypothetical protein
VQKLNGYLAPVESSEDSEMLKYVKKIEECLKLFDGMRFRKRNGNNFMGILRMFKQKKNEIPGKCVHLL